MKKIYLIRHGQSRSQTGEADKEDMNPSLSKLGRKQAQRLRPLVKGITFDLIILSTMERAIQTYELSKAKGKRICFDSRLIEGDWGIPNYYQSLVGLSSRLNPIAEADKHDAYLVPFEQRVEALLKDLIASPNGTILLFGHFGIFSRLLAHFLGIHEDDRIGFSHMENTALSILEIQDDGKRTLGVWNERAHVMHPFKGMA